MNARSISAQLAVATVKAAIRAWQLLTNRIHHSDRSSQYAYEVYRALLADHGLVGSMGRRGLTYDNVKSKSHIKALKVQEIYLVDYENLGDVTTDLLRIIDKVYSTRTLQSVFGYLSLVHLPRCRTLSIFGGSSGAQVRWSKRSVNPV